VNTGVAINPDKIPCVAGAFSLKTETALSHSNYLYQGGVDSSVLSA
jgi:hypothetical protein